MSAALTQLADFLVTEGVVTARNTDIFLTRFKSSPDTCLALFENSGEPPITGLGAEGISVENPQIQIVARGPANDYDTAFDLAHAAMVALGTFKRSSTTDGIYVRIQQTPGEIGRDGRDRVLVGFNVTLGKVLS